MRAASLAASRQTCSEGAIATAVAAFDTLKFVETLHEAGVPEVQAKVMSPTMHDTHETAELVTGRDRREAAMTIGAGIQALRAELHAIELQLAIRLSGIVVVALGAFTALSKWTA